MTPMQPGESSEEVLKRVRTAGVFLRRGDLDAARSEVEDAIRQHGETSELLELHGDILVERGDRENAALAYHRAYQINPGAASAETKYARLVLAIKSEADQAEQAREMMEGESVLDAKPGNAVLACLASAVWPGLGQWYNGETNKAAILAGTAALGVLILLVTGDLQRIFVLLFGGFSLGSSGIVDPRRVSLISWLVWGGAGMAWLYAVIDAPIHASRRSARPGADLTEPHF